MQWCGLKYCGSVVSYIAHKSPLMQWCGLKFCTVQYPVKEKTVTTDAVVWIEIVITQYPLRSRGVTTDAVVWIEIRSCIVSWKILNRHH